MNLIKQLLILPNSPSAEELNEGAKPKREVDGGKWHEEPHSGEPDYRWGTSYMSYLTPSQVMSWIQKDYRRGMEVEGPFATAEEAEEYAKHNWSGDHSSLDEAVTGELPKALRYEIYFNNGKTQRFLADTQEAAIKKAKGLRAKSLIRVTINGARVGKPISIIEQAENMSEAITYTDFDDWKDAVKNSYPEQAKKMKFKGRMEGDKMTVSAEVPGVDRCFGVWDQDEDTGTVLSEGKTEKIAELRKEYERCMYWVANSRSDREARDWTRRAGVVANHLKKQYQVEVKESTQEGFSPYKPNAKVTIIGGPKDVIGKQGTIGEVKTANGKKSFVVDYDHDYKSDKPNFGAKSVQLDAKDVKLCKPVKEEKQTEQLEVINKAHADHGAAKKVFFTGTREECYEFMRSHKSLKLDLMYKDSARLASYSL